MAAALRGASPLIDRIYVIKVRGESTSRTPSRNTLFCVTFFVDTRHSSSDSTRHRKQLLRLPMSEEITPYQVVPKTPLAGSAAAQIRDQGEITRRSFPWVLTIAWTT